LAGTLEL